MEIPRGLEFGRGECGLGPRSRNERYGRVIRLKSTFQHREAGRESASLFFHSWGGSKWKHFMRKWVEVPASAPPYVDYFLLEPKSEVSVGHWQLYFLKKKKNDQCQTYQAERFQSDFRLIAYNLDSSLIYGLSNFFQLTYSWSLTLSLPVYIFKEYCMYHVSI